MLNFTGTPHAAQASNSPHNEGSIIMANDSKMELGLWERFTDSVGSFSEGVVGFLGRMFGSNTDRYVKNIGYLRSRDPEVTHTVVPGSILAQVNALEETMAAKSEAELKGMAAHWRERFAAG